MSLRVQFESQQVNMILPVTACMLPSFSLPFPCLSLHLLLPSTLSSTLLLPFFFVSPPQSSPERQTSPVIKEVVAIHDYSAQFSDELNFSAGDRIQVTIESKCSISQHTSIPLPPQVVSQYSSQLAPISVAAVMKVIDPATATNVDLRDIKIVKKLG